MFDKYRTVSLEDAPKLAALMTGFNAIVMIRFLLQISKGQHQSMKQAKFLADFVERNHDRLEEFDIIALRELGLLKDAVEA
jgi:hypothetical protein